ncbi:MAG TPA: hypothetical protein VMA34_11275 [Terracidiphilus sp.]|nr:hypothetical protein [Terracidiphilus sp.]
MKAARLTALKILALAFLLPGLGGLIGSAIVSAHYLDVMPKHPDPGTLQMIPRNIHGTVIYQTARQNQRLNLLEYVSVGVFAVGLAVGLIYLEQWGSTQNPDGEEAPELAQNHSS